MLIQERARMANRIQKLLESANLKLGSVASDIQGVAARAILHALVAGERDSEQLAALAKGKPRATPEQLHDALQGRFTAHHTFLLKQWLAQLDFVSAQITGGDQEGETLGRPFTQTY